MAARDLARRRKHQQEATLIAVALGVLAVAMLPLAADFTAPLAAGAAAGVLVAAVSALSRQDRIAGLALDPLAHALPDVAQYASHLTARLERERLASWLMEILAEAEVPGNWYLAHRVHRYAEDLRALSRDLADPRAEDSTGKHGRLSPVAHAGYRQPTLQSRRAGRSAAVDHREDSPRHQDLGRLSRAPRRPPSAQPDNGGALRPATRRSPIDMKCDRVRPTLTGRMRSEPGRPPSACGSTLHRSKLAARSELPPGTRGCAYSRECRADRRLREHLTETYEGRATFDRPVIALDVSRRRC